MTGEPPDGIDTVITGMPTLIRDGEIVDRASLTISDYPGNLRQRNPRTAICSHDDGRTVMMVVVEGRGPGRAGMTGSGLAHYLRQTLGCRHAVALDGGGSSAMFIRGQPGFSGLPQGIVNRIASSRERGLCCHLGVRIDPGQAMWRAEFVDQSPPPTVVAGASFHLWVRFRNTGRRTWRSNAPWPVTLIADGPPGYLSPFYLEDEWLSLSTPAAVEAVTAPGELGTFLFRAVAPPEPGIYAVDFVPVASGPPEAQRMSEAAAHWEVRVECPVAEALTDGPP